MFNLQWRGAFCAKLCWKMIGKASRQTMRLEKEDEGKAATPGKVALSQLLACDL